ncbi:thiamine phosphate synthase [Paraconexibacter antarcticus]|uniref:Thiamine-phosphate synthase n=1 Tax=Paraconexibacter antarcticus TaxID=2949664 RepID=A0ABY5DVV5_9ACTN|nr:thiamine phosphate synthase [Paraconexibacter antarcticus]UTI64785.1 thiamine phosphate synthase [Paraconexibacter antarcticus]
MDRRAQLGAARLYLVTGAIAPARLRAALASGVDVVQLRIKDPAGDDELLREAAVVRAACAEAGALFVLNDRPDLVAAAGADGVHVGQDDIAVAAARALVGPDRLVGLSTHSPAQIDAAHVAAGGVDYIGVGPVHATPTKPGRDAVGLELVRHAAARATLPFFAIGGIDAGNAAAVRAAGAARIAVVRAITEAEDPAAAARALRAAVLAPADRPARPEAPVGLA